jgi:hypothetical protein
MSRCPHCGDKLYKMLKFPNLNRCYRCAQYWREDAGKLYLEKTCPYCGGDMEEGHFRVACRNCNPFQFEPCGICGTARLWCCC